MITAFSDPKILEVTIFFKVVDARGVTEDGVGRGVAREVLTEFWHLFYQSLSVGASTKVPTIRHDYQKHEWKAVARILLYGYLKEGVYPVALSPAFVGCTILGEDCVSNQVLVESFMAYIAENEREVVNNCLKNTSEIADNDDLLDVLGSYNCYRKPNEENIEDILCQLAHQELIQRSRYVSNSPSLSKHGKYSSILRRTETDCKKSFKSLMLHHKMRPSEMLLQNTSQKVFWIPHIL